MYNLLTLFIEDCLKKTCVCRLADLFDMIGFQQDEIQIFYESLLLKEIAKPRKINLHFISFR